MAPEQFCTLAKGAALIRRAQRRSTHRKGACTRNGRYLLDAGGQPQAWRQLPANAVIRQDQDLEERQAEGAVAVEGPAVGGDAPLQAQPL